MTSRLGLQTISIDILSNISRSKDNETIKLGQLIEYNKTNIFLQNHTKNDAGRLALYVFLLFKKALYEVKASGLQLIFKMF